MGKVASNYDIMGKGNIFFKKKSGLTHPHISVQR